MAKRLGVCRSLLSASFTDGLAHVLRELCKVLQLLTVDEHGPLEAVVDVGQEHSVPEGGGGVDTSKIKSQGDVEKGGGGGGGGRERE